MEWLKAAVAPKDIETIALELEDRVNKALAQATNLGRGGERSKDLSVSTIHVRLIDNLEQAQRLISWLKGIREET